MELHAWLFLRVEWVFLLLCSSSLAQLVITAQGMRLLWYSALQAGKTNESNRRSSPPRRSGDAPLPREIYMGLEMPDVKRLFARVTVSQDQLNGQMKQALMTSTKSRQQFEIVTSEHQLRGFKRQRSGVATYNITLKFSM